MIEKRSEDFQAHFFGSHFFNPARYLNLLEIIPTSFTKKEIIDFMMILEKRLLVKLLFYVKIHQHL